MKKQPPHAIDTTSADPRVNEIRKVARLVRNGSALTPELCEAISDLNAECAKSAIRNQPPEPRKRA